MKRRVILTLFLSLALSASAAQALEWESNAGLVVKVSPYVKATGYHQVLVTEVLVGENLFPIHFRVNSGQLQESGVLQAVCLTPWIDASDTLGVTCVTVEIDDPCENGWWQAFTIGQLVGHFKGGTKQGFSHVTMIDCECV
jgi:hypothetical protein